MADGTLRLAIPEAAGRRSHRVRASSLLRGVIALMIVANLGRIPLLSTGDREAPLLLNDVCMLFMIGVAALSGVMARSFRLDRVSIIALVFASVGAYSALLAIPRYGLSPFQLLVSLAYLVRWLMYFGLYVAVINVVHADDVLDIWHTLERTILAFATFGLVQAVFIPHFAQVVYPNARVYTDFDEQGHRLVSTVLEPNMAGAMILLVLLVQIAQLAGGDRQARWKPLLLFAALVATLSRSSAVALLTGCLVVLFVRGVSRRAVQAMAFIFVIACAAAPKLIVFATSYNKLKIDGSAMTRVVSWLRAFRILSDHPLLGIGFNTYAFVQERYGYVRLGNGTYSLDGGLLFIAVLTGAAGVALFIWMLAVVVRRCRSVWRDPAAPLEWRSLATGIGAGTIALCVHSVFVNSLLTPFVMEPLFLLWGMGFVMARAMTRPAVIRSAQAGLASPPAS